MIRINLLPVKRKKKKKPVPRFAVIGVLLMVAAVIVTVFVLSYLNSEAAELRAKKAKNAQTIAELEEKIKEVRNYEKLNETYEARRNIVEQLKMNQSLPVRVLDELSRKLTSGVWFIGMNIAGSSINMNGVGFTNSEIVKFVQSLKASKLFADVYLHETVRTNIEGVDAYTFSISLRVVG